MPLIAQPLAKYTASRGHLRKQGRGGTEHLEGGTFLRCVNLKSLPLCQTVRLSCSGKFHLSFLCNINGGFCYTFLSSKIPKPGFPVWVRPKGPRGAETLANRQDPTFTRR